MRTQTNTAAKSTTSSERCGVRRFARGGADQGDGFDIGKLAAAQDVAPIAVARV